MWIAPGVIGYCSTMPYHPIQMLYVISTPCLISFLIRDVASKELQAILNGLIDDDGEDEDIINKFDIEEELTLFSKVHTEQHN